MNITSSIVLIFSNLTGAFESVEVRHLATRLNRGINHNDLQENHRLQAVDNLNNLASKLEELETKERQKLHIEREMSIINGNVTDLNAKKNTIKIFLEKTNAKHKLEELKSLTKIMNNLESENKKLRLKLIKKETEDRQKENELKKKIKETENNVEVALKDELAGKRRKSTLIEEIKRVDGQIFDEKTKLEKRKEYLKKLSKEEIMIGTFICGKKKEEELKLEKERRKIKIEENKNGIIILEEKLKNLQALGEPHKGKREEYKKAREEIKKLKELKKLEKDLSSIEEGIEDTKREIEKKREELVELIESGSKWNERGEFEELSARIKEVVESKYKLIADRLKIEKLRGMRQIYQAVTARLVGWFSGTQIFFTGLRTILTQNPFN